jgi:hypothetical protein
MENETLIRQCLEGNPADAQNTFNQLMMVRINDQINSRKQEVAQTLYLQPAE